MSNWLAHHLASFADALRRLLRAPVAALFTALAIGVAITLPMSLYLTLKNVSYLAGDLPTQPEISLFITDSSSQAERDAIKQKIEAHPAIGRHRFISREAALERLNAQGLADVTAGLDRNPLPDAWVFTPRQDSPREMERLRQELAALPGVERVHADSVWAERMQALLGIGRQVILLLTTLFGVALIAIASNAIRAQILARREEIEVSRLIGATDRYIRRPFLYYGALQGASGALAALGILALLGIALDGPVSQLATLYGSPFRLLPLGLVEAGLVVGGATLFSWLGAWLAVGRTLRKFD
jgi:cell division transport system permease protein